MSEMPLRAVYDCNVLLQAVLSRRGPASRCLSLVEEGRVVLLLSAYAMEEIRDVLARPAIRRRYPQLTETRLNAFFDLLSRRAALIDMVPHVIDFPRDRKDEPYLNLAVAGAAQYLVTRDARHLLPFATERSPEAEAFRRLCPGIRLIDPVDFLKAVEP